MIWTNKIGLNDAMASAIKNDPYTKGDADYSVTELLKPARIRALEKLHDAILETDVSDRIFSLYGQITHGILERANKGGVAEQRYFAYVDGVKITCAVDLLEGTTVSEYKFVTAWKAKKGADISDYVSQVNLQAYILEKNNIEVGKLQIVALLRDWSKMEASRDPDYPQSQVVVIPIVRWPDKMVYEFLSKRIKAHEGAKKELPECDELERWEKPPKFAVKKPGRYAALRLLDTEEDAKKFIALQPKNGDLFIENRKGVSIRCSYYCAVGAQGLCEQWEKIKGVPQVPSTEDAV